MLPLIALLAAGFGRPSQSDGFEQRMVAALDQHESAAPNAESELELVAEFDAIAASYESEWLPDYWAAYILTQIVMTHPEERADRLEMAQDRLDRAVDRHGAGSHRADMLGLQSLIYLFATTIATDETEHARVEQQRDAAIAAAIAVDPESPVVQVFAATDAISMGEEQDDKRLVLAGRNALEAVQSRLARDQTPWALTTHFNSEWIGPWIGWANEILAGGENP